MKKAINLLSILFLLSSCQGLSDAKKALKNEKVKTTDEFLVKKKEPLVLPPDYKKIPEPGSLSKKSFKEDEDKIKEMLKSPKEENVNKRNSTSTEQSILNQIRK